MKLSAPITINTGARKHFISRQIEFSHVSVFNERQYGEFLIKMKGLFQFQRKSIDLTRQYLKQACLV